MLILAVVLSLFAGRLVQLQGLDATTYASEAEAGRLRTAVLPAVRGTITDRNGVALATTVAAVNITADQTLVTDPQAESVALAPVLGVDAAQLQATLTGTKRFVYVAKTVTPELWNKVRDLNLPDTTGLPGIFGEATSKRIYPGGETGANIVGFVDADGKGPAGWSTPWTRRWPVATARPPSRCPPAAGASRAVSTPSTTRSPARTSPSPSTGTSSGWPRRRSPRRSRQRPRRAARSS